MANEGWRDVVLMTIRETPNKKKEGHFYGLWVVMRVTPDDKCFGVTVRSGESFLMNGERRYPKDGLNEFDFYAIKEATAGDPVKSCSCGKTRSPTVFDEVRKLLDRKNPPPVGGPPPPASDEIEPCPFD